MASIASWFFAAGRSQNAHLYIADVDAFAGPGQRKANSAVLGPIRKLINLGKFRPFIRALGYKTVIADWSGNQLLNPLP